MKSVITGDLIGSRKIDTSKWIDTLKAELQLFGDHWDIYRGDSFQLMLDAKDALLPVLHIKSAIKQIVGLDVRMAIGIGSVDYLASRVLESNGSAFVHSGECYEQLKKQTLMIKSDFAAFDEKINLMFSLATLNMDYWKPVTAQTVYYKLKYPSLNQQELMHKLGKKSQSAISEGLKRGGFDELRQLMDYFHSEIIKL